METAGTGPAEARSVTVLLLSGIALVACAASPAMKAARLGDRSVLRTAVNGLLRKGGLSNRDAASLAAEVAARELREAAPADAVANVREVRPCARELDEALASRMRTHDAAGAEAALAREEAGGLELSDMRSFATDGDPHWRAVGARALVRKEDRLRRRSALLDPDPLVRRQAARAAKDAADPEDLAALAEAARVDPEPLVRTEAIRAVAQLPVAPDSRVAFVLRDLWNTSDEGSRQDIAGALTAAAIWRAGGREALRVLLSSGEGPAVVEGASAVIRRTDAGDEMLELATSQLARAIASGTPAQRLQALALAPLDRPSVLAAIKNAALDDDLRVRIGALARLAPEDAGAVRALERIAAPASPVGAIARAALAGAGDRRVQAWIEQDLGASSASERLGAAGALATLGVEARAASLLADDEPRVRLRAACVILVAARRL